MASKAYTSGAIKSPEETFRDDNIERSKAMNKELRKRRLPQMVNWWDASVLAMVGVRTVISGTIGNVL